MTTAQWIDRTCVAIAIILPALLVWFGRRRAFVLGVPVYCVVIYASGPLISMFDPLDEGASHDTAWLLFRWLSGLMICTFVWLIKLLFYRLTSGGADRHGTPPGHCTTCGYNLTGNESGICSECGTPIPAAIKRPGR